MKKVAVLVLCALCLLGAREASATGIGPYFEYMHGTFSPKIDEVFGLGVAELESDFKANHLSFGFLLDTCTSRDKLFNYRFTIGLDIVPLKLDSIEGLGIKVDPETLGIDVGKTGWGFNMKHTFGFGIVRTSAIRVWAGPAIRFYCDFYGDLANPYNIYVYKTDKDNLVLLGGGGGPEVGVNIHLGGAISLSLSAGYNFNYTALVGSEKTLTGAEHMFFVQASPIFNLGEDRNAWQ